MGRGLAAMLIVLSTTACGVPDDAETSLPDSTPGDATPVTAPPATTPPTTPSDAAAPPWDTVTARLAIEGGGLRVFLVPSGSARPIEFGRDREEVMRALTTVQGAPLETNENVDCAARFANWDDGLTVWFSNDRFVGWSVREGSAVTTASGIGVGSTRRQLEDVYVIEAGPSTIGFEFTAGELAGLLESDRPDARITNLWSGAVCIAR